MSMFLFFSGLLGKKIVDAKRNETAGKICDLIVPLGEPYPKVVSVVARRGLFGQRVRIPFEQIQDITADPLVVKNGSLDTLKPAAVSGSEIMLKEEVLDQQIVDTFGCKVLRVNDLHFLKANNELRVAHVDIGFRGLVRRMGWERTVDKLTQLLFDYKLADHFISWKYVQPLSTLSPGQTLKLNVSQGNLSHLHPADLAEVIEDLSIYQRTSLLRALDPEAAAEALNETEPEMQVTAIEGMSNERAATILDEMPLDSVVDLLQDLPKEKADELLTALPMEKRTALVNLLSHHESTAGGFMTTNYLACAPGFTVEQAMSYLRSHAKTAELVGYIYVVADDGTLLGVVSIRDLLPAERGQRLADLMTSRVISVRPKQRHSTILDLFLKYGFTALPVVQSKGSKMLGIITFHDVAKAAAVEAKWR